MKMKLDESQQFNMSMGSDVLQEASETGRIEVNDCAFLGSLFTSIVMASYPKEREDLETLDRAIGVLMRLGARSLEVEELQ